MKGLKSIVGSNVKYPLYLGNFADGEVSTTGNITFTNTLDGPAVVKSYKKLTVNAGHTITVQNPCRGLIIYANELIVNGTITMSEKGSDSVPISNSEYKIPLKSYHGEIKEWIELPQSHKSITANPNSSGITSCEGSGLSQGGNGQSATNYGLGGSGGLGALYRGGTTSLVNRPFSKIGTCFTGGANSKYSMHTTNTLTYSSSSVIGNGGALIVIIARKFSGNGLVSSIGRQSTYISTNGNGYISYTVSSCLDGSCGSGPISIYSNEDLFTGILSSPEVITPSQTFEMPGNIPITTGSALNWHGGNGGAGYIHRQVI